MQEQDEFVVKRIVPSGALPLPLLLLHGSGRTEDDLIDFGHALGPYPLLAPRGRVAFEGGFAFFRRNADRSLDHDDLDLRTTELRRQLRIFRAEGWPPPLVIGYSNGAIIAAAMLMAAERLSRGTALLRPLSPAPSRAFPALDGYPVLLLSGARDERRDASDAPHLERQLRDAGAAVTACSLDTGHDWAKDQMDLRLCQAWMKALVPEAPPHQHAPLPSA